MNESDMIARMYRNQIRMKNIEKVFFISGMTCVIINAVSAVGELLLIPVYMSSGSIFLLLQSIAALASVVFSVFSSCKKESWTMAALGTFLLRVLLLLASVYFINGEFSISYKGGIILLLGVIPQFICLRKYKELNYLKSQFGYPGFNSEIYVHRSYNKRAKSSGSSSYRPDMGPRTNSTSYTRQTTQARPVGHGPKTAEASSATAAGASASSAKAAYGSMDSVDPPPMNDFVDNRSTGGAAMDSVDPPPMSGEYEDILRKKPLI